MIRRPATRLPLKIEEDISELEEQALSHPIPNTNSSSSELITSFISKCQSYNSTTDRTRNSTSYESVSRELPASAIFQTPNFPLADSHDFSESPDSRDFEEGKSSESMEY